MVTHPVLDLIWLIPFYPLVAFLIIVLGRWAKLLPGKSGSLVVIITTLFSLGHTLLALSQWGPGYETLQHNIPWLQAGSFTLSLGHYLDPVGMMMLLVVTIVSLLIHVYTHGYMSEDPGYNKFYAYLALFNFSMLSLVLSPNLFQMYMFWEMVGVSSYLLIGFWLQKPSAAAAATKAFLVNRVGDFGLLIGILSFLFFSFHWWQGPLLAFNQIGPAAQVVLSAAGPTGFTIICLLIFMGTVAKSAQLPLHTWLPDAMEGPTPISALIHAATMVAAGVFLVARMYPAFTLSPHAMTVIAFVGGITALVAATIALTQTDIKKALAYSTMSQLGYMVLAMGIGAFTAGLFHLMTHAFFKAMLFLCSGSVIHGCHHEQDMRQMGGLRKHMPITAWTYLIGTIAITGVLPFAGFWSKDAIIGSAFHEHQMVLFGIAVVTAAMTGFYMFRTYFMTFEGEYRGHAHPHESPWVMTFPLVALAVPSVFIGLFLSGMLGFPAFGQFVHFGEFEAEVPNYMIIGISVLVGWLGLGLAYLMYKPNPVIDPAKVTNALKPLYVLSTNKWYFDKLYNGIIVRRLYLPFAMLSSWFDRTVIDGMVGLSANTVSFSGTALRSLQIGRVQSYLWLFFGAILLLAALFIWFV